MGRWDGSGNITFISSLLMAIVFQPCVLPMYEEMQPAIRNPKDFSTCLVRACVFLYFLFLAL